MNTTLDQLFILSSTTGAENGFVATLHTNPDHPIYRAHFPGNPIVPGVCLIELARVHAETALGCELKTEEISQCRFRSPILPGMEANCKLTVHKLDIGHLKLQSEIRVNGSIACQVRLKAEIMP